MNSKQIIDNYFNKNYSKLNKIAKNILKFKNNLSSDLISETYLYLNELQIQLNNENIESIIVNYMNKQLKWNITDFKNKYINLNEELSEDINDKIDDEYINIEQEFILQSKFYVYTIIINEHLTPEEKILFNFRYIDKLKYLQIAKITNLPYTTIRNLTIELNKKIKQLYKQYDNDNNYI